MSYPLILDDSVDWAVVGCLPEVAAASRQWPDSHKCCRCYCFAEVKDGHLPFDY
jgi:hypothetical protein